MAGVHLFLTAIIALSYALTVFVAPQNQFQLAPSLAIFIALQATFKRYGNLNLSGHLLAFGMALILAPMVMVSGGLYSDNLLWLLLCPLVVMLFSSKNAVFPWIAMFVAFTLYLQKLDESSPGHFKSQIQDHTPIYYFISYAMLFAVVILVVYLFKTGEESIIEDLRHNQTILEQQRQELIQANDQLRLATEHLRQSNRDLESFAYAASHDLKEPLRTISNFTKILENKLADHLTPDTSQMMFFVQDGAKRMTRLLEDLLEYSKVGRGKDKMGMVDLDDVMFYVRSNSLKMRIEESAAEVVIEKNLPHAYGRYSEMVQLFQNLIGNAIKFKKPDTAPKVTVSWVEMQHSYTISVADNGIGIEKKHYDKVFNIFERLHGKEQYEGTGIGLATCKKIIQNLGGEIWVESTPNIGTTFIFTLPKNAKALRQTLLLLSEAPPANLAPSDENHSAPSAKAEPVHAAAV